AFDVVFDRPIDPLSFTAAMVKVIYRNPSTLGTMPGTDIPVGSVQAIDLGTFGPALALGATTFRVHLTTPQTAVGTYSYYITPGMHDRVRTKGLVIVPVATTTYSAVAPQINLPIPPTGTGGTNTPADITASS